MLYYPSDASWALIAIPAPTAVVMASLAAWKIAGTTKPISVLLTVFWLLNIVSMFVFDSFTWRELIQSLFAAGTGCMCFEMMDNAEKKTKA